MYCIYLTRALNGNLKCKLTKEVIIPGSCSKCLKMQRHANVAIIKKTDRLKKIEKSRYSILTEDLKSCYWCYRTKHIKAPKDDLHEIYPGRNRIRSMKYGFVVPLCRAHHENQEVLQKLKTICQKKYEESHTREEFLNIIDKNYLK